MLQTLASSRPKDFSSMGALREQLTEALTLAVAKQSSGQCKQVLPINYPLQQKQESEMQQPWHD
jgi:hypothetical protein